METHPNADSHEGRPSMLPGLIIGVVGVYLAGFAAIVLDELIFRTFVFSGNTPPWVSDVVAVVYWPLIQLLRSF